MIILHVLFRLKYLVDDVIKIENIYSIDANLIMKLYIYISPFLHIFSYYFVLFLGMVALHSAHYPGPHCVDQAGLQRSASLYLFSTLTFPHY